MNTQELLKKVRRIEIKTKRLSNQLFSGEYHSSFKGRGMAFSEVRKYSVGDDIRAIDWNVTARLNEPYIKVFEEERELSFMLIVDLSASESFGSQTQTKREYITEICATLAFSAIQNNDKVGLMLFSDEVELFIPPKKGKSHILRIIRELLEFEPKSKGTDINQALRYFSGVHKKKAIAFIISDFQDKDYLKSLQLLAKRHDVTGIMVNDLMEEELPNLGLIQVLDPETQKIKWIDTNSSQIRNQHKAEFLRKSRYFQESFRRASSGSIKMNLQDNYAFKLLSYFKQKASHS